MAKFEDVLQDYDRLKAELHEAKKKALAPMRAALLSEMKEAFKQVPQAHSIRWTQYTPYFNDGDECVFRVNEMYALDEDGEELETWGANKVDISAFPDPSSIDDDIMEDLFGDHVEITLGRDDDDFTVDEYSHD